MDVIQEQEAGRYALTRRLPPFFSLITSPAVTRLQPKDRQGQCRTHGVDEHVLQYCSHCTISSKLLEGKEERGNIAKTRMNMIGRRKVIGC